MSKKKKIPENSSPPENNSEEIADFTEDTQNQNNQQTSLLSLTPNPSCPL